MVLSEAVEAEAAGDWVQVCRAAVASAESKEGRKEAEAKVAVTVVETVVAERVEALVEVKVVAGMEAVKAAQREAVLRLELEQSANAAKEALYD